MQIVHHSDDELHVRAPAKINLFLDVLRKRDDGYHEIETIVQEISLYDDLILKKTEDSLTLKCSDPALPTDEENLVLQAAHLLREITGINARSGADIELIKNIPAGAGLGGGSSDAAAALKGLNILWDIELTERDLLDLAARLGSDVPFFIAGGTALCRGRGEIIAPLKTCQSLSYVVFCPNIHISTRVVYDSLKSKIGLTSNCNDATMLRAQLASGGPEAIGELLYNKLESVVFGLYPAVRRLAQELSNFGFCGVLLSGSGSSIFGLCRSGSEAEGIRSELTAKCGSEGKVVVAQS